MKMFKIFFSLFFLFFRIKDGSTHCTLSFRNDLTHSQPLLVTNTRVPSFLPVHAHPPDGVEVPGYDSIILACPGLLSTTNQFAHLLKKNTIIARCTTGKTFVVDGTGYTFDRLQCINQSVPLDSRTYSQCLGENTELIIVGYPVNGNFLGVYEVCFHKEELASLFAKVIISPYLSKNTVQLNKYTPWTTNYKIFNNINVDSSYNCERQIESFKAITGKPFLKGNCCYEKGQLVSSKDVIYEPEKTATHHSLNAIPLYSSCSHVNWEEIQNRVRKLAENLESPLTVWTGQNRKIRGGGRLNLFHYDLYLHYTKDKEHGIPVPQFIWKVVYDPKTQQGIAIILINQDITLNDVDNLVLCRDICDNVNWLNFLARKTISKGYIYCCDINEFEFAFGFRTDSPIPPTVNGVLRDSTRNRW